VLKSLNIIEFLAFYFTLKYIIFIAIVVVLCNERESNNEATGTMSYRDIGVKKQDGVSAYNHRVRYRGWLFHPRGNGFFSGKGKRGSCPGVF
jgi:hypothetical protein